MSRSLTPVVVLTAAVALGCSGRSAPTSNASDARYEGIATVIDENALEHAGGDVLNVLPSYVTGMRVRRTDNCPEITMRGARSLFNSNNPIVYVDGTRSGNTCILETLVPTEVERIEIYPMGVTTRPGYRNNPNGLILVFMKTSDGA